VDHEERRRSNGKVINERTRVEWLFSMTVQFAFPLSILIIPSSFFSHDQRVMSSLLLKSFRHFIMEHKFMEHSLLEVLCSERIDDP